MKKHFNFGLIDYFDKGEKVNTVTIDAELKEDNPDRPTFTASGTIWNKYKTGTVAGGQCLDTIKEYLKDTNKEFNTLFEMWQKYHLNDMRPECEHQRALKWDEQASEPIKIYKYTLNIDTISTKNTLEQNFLKAIKNGETITATPEQQKILKLKYSYDSPIEDIGELKQYYKFKEVETKLKGWTTPEEHPAGILGKVCPVCGYKYGHDWQYLPIEPQDLETIKKLLGGGDNE